MKTVVLIILTLLWVGIIFGGVSSYIVIDEFGIDTDVFLSAQLTGTRDFSVNAILSIKRIGLELAVVTPLLMRGITVNFCLTENFELMFEHGRFSPGFGVGFSLRF